MKILNTLLTLTAITLCSFNVSSAADDAEVILNLTNEWTYQIQSGDTQSLSGFYTQDAVMLPPTSEILLSHEAIQNYWELIKSAGVTEYFTYPVSVRIEGDTAYQTALWEANRHTSSGQTISMQGNISNVLVKQSDGSWKIKMQSWN